MFRLRRVRVEGGARATLAGAAGTARAHPRSTPASPTHGQYIPITLHITFVLQLYYLSSLLKLLY